MSFRLATLSCLALATACVHARPFTNSSADFNRGQPHEATVRADVDTVAAEISNVMRERGALIIKRRETSSDSVVLSFRQSAERAVGSVLLRPTARAADTRLKNEYVDFGSLYYVELSSNGTGSRTVVKALGLPVIDGVTACPDAASRYRDCAPATSGGLESYADVSLEHYGIRVDGARERDHVLGLLAELQLRWPESRAQEADPAASTAANEAFAH